MSFESLIQNIKQEKRPCVFVSPHLDDAILSCGNLIHELSQHTRVTVLTVFSAADAGRSTLSGRAFLKQCGAQSALGLYQQRREEDAGVAERAGAQVTHLGFVEALWRKRSVGKLRRFFGRFFPEFLALYPTYRWHVQTGLLAQEDQARIQEVAAAIREKVPKEARLFFPLGLGRHVDHVLTHEVGLLFGENVIFYADFPYLLSTTDRPTLLVSRGFEQGSFEEHLEKKHALIRLYETQRLFSGPIPAVPETYYFSKV